jgi:protein-disulfide isomerase
VEFSDFQCPFCSRSVTTLKQIETEYPGKVRVAFKNQPLPFHQHARLAAEAAMAANEQGKFWEYHDKLFANQPKIQREFLLQYARDVGLDMKRFQKALDDASGRPRIDTDIAEANSLGTSGTPAFFINGRFLNGAKPFAEFAKVINVELDRLKIDIPLAARKPS